MRRFLEEILPFDSAQGASWLSELEELLPFDFAQGASWLSAVVGVACP